MFGIPFIIPHSSFPILPGLLLGLDGVEHVLGFSSGSRVSD